MLIFRTSRHLSRHLETEVHFRPAKQITGARLPRYEIRQWDRFENLATGTSDRHCTIKETLFIPDLQPSLNEYVSSEKLNLC